LHVCERMEPAPPSSLPLPGYWSFDNAPGSDAVPVVFILHPQQPKEKRATVQATGEAGKTSRKQSVPRSFGAGGRAKTDANTVVARRAFPPRPLRHCAADGSSAVWGTLPPLPRSRMKQARHGASSSRGSVEGGAVVSGALRSCLRRPHGSGRRMPRTFV